MKSIIRDLAYRIEGYGDNPDYNIESITRFSHGRIVIVLREPQGEQETKTEETATEQKPTETTDGEQTEQGAENDSNK